MMVEEKKVVEEVTGWLRLYDDGSVDRSMSPPSDVAPPHDEFVDSVSVRDVIADPATGLRLRLYLPSLEPKGAAGFPILLHFHGGGFCISEADWGVYYPVYSRLARSGAGAIVASVFLPLAPERRLPAASHAAFSALRWLHSRPAPLALARADCSRLFLVGDSSGANLVHHVAARAAAQGIPVAGAIPIHPGFVRSARSRSERENPQTPFLTLEMADKFLAMALPEGATKDHPMTCPMSEDLPPVMPPVLLCLAEKDLFWDTEMEYYEAMKQANHDVELFVNPGMTHSFYLNKLAVDNDPHTAEQADRLFTAIVDFVNRH